MSIKHSLLIGFSVAVLGACQKSPSDDKAQAAASAAPMSDDAIDKAQIPVKEDYEEQARQTITADNLDEQLGQLEKQIKDDH